MEQQVKALEAAVSGTGVAGRGGVCVCMCARLCLWVQAAQLRRWGEALAPPSGSCLLCLLRAGVGGSRGQGGGSEPASPPGVGTASHPL